MAAGSREPSIRQATWYSSGRHLDDLAVGPPHQRRRLAVAGVLVLAEQLDPVGQPGRLGGPGRTRRGRDGCRAPGGHGPCGHGHGSAPPSHAHQGPQRAAGRGPAGPVRKREGRPEGSGRPSSPAAHPPLGQCTAGQSARAGQVLQEAAEGALPLPSTQRWQTPKPIGLDCCRADIDEAGSYCCRLCVESAEGFPAREQLGGLELELLHRDSGHGASLGAIALRARQPGGFTWPGTCGAGSRTWCTLSVERTVRSPPYTTHLWSVNAGEPRLISGNHDGAPLRKAG